MIKSLSYYRRHLIFVQDKVWIRETQFLAEFRLNLNTGQLT